MQRLRAKVEDGLGALKVQGFKDEEGFVKSMKRRSLSVEYIIFVRGGQSKGLFDFKKRICFGLAVLTYGILNE